MRSLMTSSATKTKKQIAHISSVLHGRSAALNHYSYGRYYAPTEGESFAIPAWVRAALAIVQDLQPDRVAQANFADRFTGGATIKFPADHTDRMSGSGLKHLNY